MATLNKLELLIIMPKIIFVFSWPSKTFSLITLNCLDFFFNYRGVQILEVSKNIKLILKDVLQSFEYGINNKM